MTLADLYSSTLTETYRREFLELGCARIYNAAPDYCVAIDPAVRSHAPGRWLSAPVFPLVTDNDRLPCLQALDRLPPGWAIFIHNLSERQHALIDGIYCLDAVTQGAAGLVVDGAVQGVHDIARNYFPVYSRSSTYVMADTGGAPTVEVPAVIALNNGKAIEPGDWLFGDEDGLLVVKARHLTEVFSAARRLRQEEEGLRASLRNGRRLNELIGTKQCLAGKDRRHAEVPPVEALVGANVSPSVALADAQQPFPLADLQQAYWLGRKGVFELGEVSPHAWFEWEAADLDHRRLETAWNLLVRRHDVLRATPVSDDALHILAEAPDTRIPLVDLTALAPAEIEARLAAVRAHMANAPGNDFWPMFELCVLSLPGNLSRVFLRFDLMVLDGRSLRTILDEWGQLYEQPDADLPALGITYRDFALARQKLKKTDAYAAAQAYWRQRLGDLPSAPELPLAADAATLRSYSMRHHARILDRTLWNRFKQTAQLHNLTPTAAVCAAFCDVLRAWSAQGDFTLNMLVDHRPPLHPDVERLAGSCTTTLLLQIRSGETFLDRAAAIQQQLWDDLEHLDFSGVDVLRELNSRRGQSGMAAMPVVFSSELGFGAAQNGIFPGRQIGRGVQTPYVLFDHQVREKDGELELALDVVEEAYPAGLPTLLLDACRDRLAALACDREAWNSIATDVLPETDRHLIAAANATDAPIPTGLLHEPFFDYAAARPDALAVIDPSGALTYGDLAARAGTASQWLRQGGAAPNQLVAIFMRKGWGQIAAALAIAHAGAAYLPIDPAWPANRILSLLHRCDVRLILTDSHHIGAIDWPEQTKAAAIDRLPAAADIPLPAPVVQPSDLAYVIFTSGSTGEPKGVMIDHRGAKNTVIDINQRFAVGENDRVLGLSSLSFDLSVYDIFGVLGVGGAVILPDPDKHGDPVHWTDLVLAHHVTLWNSVPALFDVFVEFNRNEASSLAGIRLALLSGDWIAPDLPQRAHALNPGLDLISLGGATEASIWSIWHQIEKGRRYEGSIPYGKALSNQKMYVLDERLSPRPVGIAGEIYIGGIGLTKGYWGAPDLTEQRLVASPHSGDLLYRTGDLGRLMADGNIEFLGRADFQVKIRGFRIELTEIESALAKHPAVRGCVVAALGPARGGKRLVAYVLPQEEDDLPSEKDLCAFLQERLPSYMVPEAIVTLKALPLSANGKIDRKALPDPGARSGVCAVAPESDLLLRRVAAAWTEVLGCGSVGPNDNFFDLGGNSLLAMRVMAKLQDVAGRRIPLASLFRSPTVAGMAAILRSVALPAENYATVVPLRRGSGMPIYLIHPIGGNVLCYATLERELGGDFPVIGLQAVGVTGSETPLDDIAAMAERYLADIRQQHPPGPEGWCLAGWSMGGIIAYEMARQLEESGEGPVHVIAIDGRLDESGGLEQLDIAALLAWFAHDLGHGGQAVELDPSGLSESDALHSFYERAKTDGLLPPETEEGEFRSLFELFRRHAGALARYRALPFRGSVDLLLARDAGNREACIAAWEQATGGRAVVREIPADHYRIVARPAVEIVAGAIRQARHSLMEAACQPA